MRKSFVSCDKCAGEIEPRTGLALTLPGPTAAQPQPVRAVDLCETHAAELVRWLGEPLLSVTALERRVTELGAENERLASELASTPLALDVERWLGDKLPETVPSEYPPTEPPGPLVARTPSHVSALAPPLNEPLPEGFRLPGHAFSFSTEAPPVATQDPPASPLDFCHAGQS